jgi:5'-AMP-activated protein kinase regulatory gamma subunit
VHPEPGEDVIMGMKADTSAASCLKGLRDYNIHSFPVTPVDNESKVIGVIDAVDFCAYVLDFFKLYDGITTWKTFEELWAQRLQNKTVQDLMNYSRTNNFHPVGTRATFKEVMEALSFPGVHRVPMINKKSHFGRFVTQTEVLHFIATNLDKFGDVLEKTVMEAGIGSHFVQRVKISSTGLEAFRILVENKVSALPVVDEHDRITGIVSSSDIRLLVSSKPSVELRLPLETFLEHIRAGEGVPQRAVIGSTSDSVRDVITRIHSNRIHRLFLVDANDRVSGVISISDIFKYLITKEASIANQKKIEEEKVKMARLKADHEAKVEKKALKSREAVLRKLVEAALESSEDDLG